MNETKTDVAAFSRRDIRTAIVPVRRGPAVSRKNTHETWHRIGSSLRQCSVCRHHRIKKRQCDGGASASQQRAAGQEFFGNEHVCSPWYLLSKRYCAAMLSLTLWFIWNGLLSTTPITRSENL